MMCYQKKRDYSVILVFDNPTYLGRVRQLLKTAFNCKILAELTDMRDYKNCIKGADLMIVGLDNQKINPYTIAQQATWDNQQLLVLAFLGDGSESTLEELIEKGFKGAINDLSQLPTCIDRLMNGKYFFPNTITQLHKGIKHGH